MASPHTPHLQRSPARLAGLHAQVLLDLLSPVADSDRFLQVVGQHTGLPGPIAQVVLLADVNALAVLTFTGIVRHGTSPERWYGTCKRRSRKRGASQTPPVARLTRRGAYLGGRLVPAHANQGE